MKTTDIQANNRYRTFREFYPFYLGEHANPVCRRLHFVGSAISLVLLGVALVLRTWPLLAAIPVVAYGCAWIGHFFFERNRPATFTYPFYSLLGDWVMFRDILVGRVRW